MEFYRIQLGNKSTLFSTIHNLPVSLSGSSTWESSNPESSGTVGWMNNEWVMEVIFTCSNTLQVDKTYKIQRTFGISNKKSFKNMIEHENKFEISIYDLSEEQDYLITMKISKTILKNLSFKNNLPN